MITFEGVSVEVRVPQGAGKPWASRPILTEVNLQLSQRRIAVIGANGSGKSTLLRLINGLVVPTSGRVLVDGIDVGANPRKVRSQVGFIFTDPLSQLVMPTPAEDVELSLRRSVPDRNARRDTALALLAERGLDSLADQSIYDLSGGERQLVALTSVLAVRPSVLVADEPTTLLDLRNRQLIRRVLGELPQQVILATHDLEIAQDADRAVVVDAGRIVFDGSAPEAVALYREMMGT